MIIGIDAGHGINTPGKRCSKHFDPNETREWSLNSRVATKVCEILNRRHIMRNRSSFIKNKQNFNFCDIILMHCFKRFTYKIYRQGIRDGFYWNNK